MNTLRNLGWCFALIISILTGTQAMGQKQIPYVNSIDSISLGVAYTDTGAYSLASACYETISENDTNYALALIEDAIAKESNEQDSAAIVLCRKGIEQESDYTSDFYNTLANSYMDEGDFTDAVNLLQDTALTKYPNIHTLYFTLGLAQYKMHKYPDAVHSFEKAIDLDIYDASSHYYLGRCCLEQGRLVPALLSFQFYLILQPQVNRSLTVVGLIEQMTENKYQYNKSYLADPSEYHDSAFTELDLLIRSKIAMSTEYKAATTINYTLAKQIQLFLEQLKYVPNTDNYWMEKYVPFFTALQQKKYLEPYLYLIMASVSENDGNFQKGIVKNTKKIKKISKWADNMLTTERSKKVIDVDGKKVAVTCYYDADNNMPYSMGPENSAGKSTGEWTFYYRHNGMIHARGKYNDDGEREGVWQWFYTTGALKETDNYINGKREDTARLWYENGAPKAVYIFHNDLLDGNCLEYNISGISTTRSTYEKDKLTGAAIYCYDDGKQQYQANYVNGQLEGELKEYYVTGQVMLIKTMQNDKKNGPYTEYWSNGKPEQTGEYKDDKQTGYWKTYYQDGSLHKEGNFDLKGDPIGKWVFYYRNGKIKETEFYNKNGDEEGIDSLFDDDGIIYEIQEYKNGATQSYTFLDKNGHLVSSSKLDGETLSMAYYTPEGTKKSEGLYVDNKKEGEWKYYTDYGELETTENFYRDKLDGETIDYYSDGKVKDSVNYSYDEKDGYYVSYYINGKMDMQGWYVDGDKQGDWYYYNSKGNLIKHTFYGNGAVLGRSRFFEDNGALSEEHFYHYGYLDKIFLYDTTGTKVIYKYISKYGNGKYLFTYNNGNTAHESNYINGSLEGPEKRYYYDGKLSEENQYLLNELQDTLKAYYENGDIKYVYKYDMGNCEGTGKSYYPNGKLQYTGTYYDDDLDGEYEHYTDAGKLNILSNYDEGDLEGEYKACYSDSIVGGIFWMHNGNILAYASADKDGKPLQRINLDKGNGDVTCYYTNGNKSITCSYEHGELVGKDLSYAPDGKLLAEKNYEEGYLDGLQKNYYDADTTVKEEDNYYYGELDGICRYYYQNGKLEHEESYSLGTKQGPFRYYDKDGNLLKTVLYFDGNEITETATE